MRIEATSNDSHADDATSYRQTHAWKHRLMEEPLPRLFLNGKFYSGATNGVHRVADRLLRELDRRAASGGPPAGWDMRLLLPAVRNWAPTFAAISVLPQRWGHTQAWEQAVLPHVARSGVLASFANLAPAAHSSSTLR